jgi:hypothetical protein
MRKSHSLRVALVAAAVALVLPAALRGARAPQDVQRLLDGLKAKAPAERIESARLLRERSPDPGPLVPVLMEALRDEYWDVRECAAELLAKAGPAARAARTPRPSSRS